MSSVHVTSVFSYRLAAAFVRFLCFCRVTGHEFTRAVPPFRDRGFNPCIALPNSPKNKLSAQLVVSFPLQHLCQHSARPNPLNGDNMKTFEVSFSYQDRKNEAQSSSSKVDASNLPGAVARATREFVKALDRKQRFDMNKNGLEIKAVHVGDAGGSSDSADSATEE